MHISILAALIGLCCQIQAGVAEARTGTCPGVDGRDGEALAQCLLHHLCIDGIHMSPRSLELPAAAVAAYRSLGIDVSARHFRLLVSLRKRPGGDVAQCDYQGPTRFMYALVEPVSETEIAVRFDPDWVY